jgi:simple sugar transport system ATP-binding protein
VPVRDKPVTIRSARQAAANGFGFCPEDRKSAGIIASASVRENMVLALQAQRGWLHPRLARSRTRSPPASSSSWPSRPGTGAAHPVSLRGQPAKGAARPLAAHQTQFLILDEPTRGIDVGAHAEIIRLIESLCANGLALLVISSELEELVGYADRVIVLRDRKQVAELATDALSVPAIMNAIACEA